MNSTLDFSYWSDPLCIWAFVGQARVDAIVRDYGESLTPRYRIVPVFGSIRQRFTSGAWSAAGPEGRMQATTRIAREFGHSDVSGQFWLDDPPSSSWAPGLAAAAVLELERRGESERGCTGRYLAELRRSLFVDNLNIAHREHQLACAESCDLARAPIEGLLDDGSAYARLWEEYTDTQSIGVRGSPTYEFDSGRELLYGNVQESIVRATVDALRTGRIAGRSDCE